MLLYGCAFALHPILPNHTNCVNLISQTYGIVYPIKAHGLISFVGLPSTGVGFIPNINFCLVNT